MPWIQAELSNRIFTVDNRVISRPVIVDNSLTCYHGKGCSYGGRWSPPLTSGAHHLGLKLRLEPTTQPLKKKIKMHMYIWLYLHIMQDYGSTKCVSFSTWHSNFSCYNLDHGQYYRIIYWTKFTKLTWSLTCRPPSTYYLTILLMCNSFISCNVQFSSHMYVSTIHLPCFDDRLANFIMFLIMAAGLFFCNFFSLCIVFIKRMRIFTFCT